MLAKDWSWCWKFGLSWNENCKYFWPETLLKSRLFCTESLHKQIWKVGAGPDERQRQISVKLF